MEKERFPAESTKILVTEVHKRYPALMQDVACSLTGKTEDLALDHCHRTLPLGEWLWHPINLCLSQRLEGSGAETHERCVQNLANPTPPIQKFILELIQRDSWLLWVHCYTDTTHEFIEPRLIMTIIKGFIGCVQCGFERSRKRRREPSRPQVIFARYSLSFRCPRNHRCAVITMSDD